MLLGAALAHGQSTPTTPAAPTPPAATSPSPAPPATSDADKAQNKARQEKQFSRLDKNSDAFVDREEFKKAKFAQKKPQRAEKRFARVDGNHDGKLSKDEWLAAPARGKKGKAAS
jgi:Ca2+-binding EF-hand superfamily protein